MKFPAEVLALKAGPSLHRVTVHSDDDYRQSLHGMVDVTGLFVKREKFGKEEPVEVDLSTREGLTAAVAHLRGLGKATPAEVLALI